MEINGEGNEIIISFQFVPPHEKQEQVESNVVEVELENKEWEKDTLSLGSPKVGKRPNTKDTYNFQKKIMPWPFKFNLGEAPLTKHQQG